MTNTNNGKRKHSRDGLGDKVFITTILVFPPTTRQQTTAKNKLSELSVLILLSKVVWALALPSTEHIRYKFAEFPVYFYFVYGTTYNIW